MGERVRLAVEIEWKRRFRPDQMRDVAQPLRPQVAGSAGERDVLAHHLRLGRIIELAVLLQVRLHNTKLDAGDEAPRND